MAKVGKDGVITVEEGKTMETGHEFVEGMQFDRGYLSPYFVTDAQTMECELEDPYILIHEKKISNSKDLVPLLEKVLRQGKPILIIAEEVEGEALATLVINKTRAAPSSAPRSRLRAMATAARPCSKTSPSSPAAGPSSRTLASSSKTSPWAIWAGPRRSRSTRTTPPSSKAPGKKQTIQARIQAIQRELEKSTSDYDKEKLSERIAKLSGGVAKINVGAATEAEMKEKKARVEDAMHATRAANQEGILPGGGVALLRAALGLKTDLEGDEKIGFDIVVRACKAPLMQISENAGQDGAVVANNVLENKKQNYGFDARSDRYCDMVEEGIIDPTKVVRCALQNAASVATLLLTSDALVAELPKEEKKPAGPGGGEDMY